MKQSKKEWRPRVVNYRKVVENGEEKWVEFDTQGYVIPAGHLYYNVIKGIYTGGTQA